MRIRINIDAAKAIKAGFNTDCRTAVVEIDPAQLEPEERTALADQLYQAGGVGGELTWKYESLAPTSDDLLASIRRLAADRAAKQQESAARQAAAREHAAAAVAAGPEAFRPEPFRSNNYPHPDGYIFSHYGDYKAAYDAAPGVQEARATIGRLVADEQAAAKTAVADARLLLADEIGRLNSAVAGYKSRLDTVSEFCSKIPQDALRGGLKSMVDDESTTRLDDLRAEIAAAATVLIFEDDDSDE